MLGARRHTDDAGCVQEEPFFIGFGALFVVKKASFGGPDERFSRGALRDFV